VDGMQDVGDADAILSERLNGVAGKGLTDQGMNWMQPFHLAARSMDTMVMELLQRFGVDANIMHGQDVLRDAALNSPFQAIRTLARNLPTMQSRQEDGNTSLHAATLRGGIEAVEMQIDFKVDVNATNHDGRTALHLAAYHGFAEKATILVVSGANVRAKDIHGRTALQLAACNGHTRTVWVLAELAGTATVRLQVRLIPIATM